MSVNNFWDDYIKSRDISRCDVIRKIYEKKLGSKIVERIEINNKAQQKAGYDLELQLEDGRILTIEEKIRNSFYPDILLEIRHENGNTKLGWLYSSQAEILSYIQPYKQGFNITLWKLKDLSLWSKSEQFFMLLNASAIKEVWGRTNFNGSKYRTKNYAISFRVLRNKNFEYKMNDNSNLPLDLW